MKKDAYYFPHDANARNDERIMYMRSKYGLSAYAIYFMIIEVMHEQSDGMLSCKLLDGLCQQINVDKTLLKDFYDDCIECELFKTDGEKYWSNRVLRNKEIFHEKREKRSIAGKKGNEIRWGINQESQCNRNAIATQSQNIAKESKVKESKVNKKEIKNTYAQFVTMTEDEHLKLTNEYGEVAANRMIEILNLYKGSKGATYKSDYMAIKNWVVSRYNEEQSKGKVQPSKNKFNNFDEPEFDFAEIKRQEQEYLEADIKRIKGE